MSNGNASLYRQPQTEDIFLAGLHWRLTQPRSRIGTRLYRQLVSLGGEKVLRSLVQALQPEEAQDAAATATEMWGAEEALRILREAHLGKSLAEADLVQLQLAFAAIVAPASIDKVSSVGDELLWESELMVSRQPKVFTGEGTFGADRASRDAWEDSLDAIIPDVRTRTILQVMAFLLLCRPLSAASRTAR